MVNGQRLIHLLVVLALVVGGCDSANDPTPQDQQQQTFLNPAQMADEYYREAQRLTPPPGVQWRPAPLLPSLPDGSGEMRGHMYEVGWGKSTAQALWFCAWLSEWAGQYNKDNSRAAAAVEQLRQFPTMEQYTQFYDEGSRAYADDLLAKVELGDVSAAHNHVRINCD